MKKRTSHITTYILVILLALNLSALSGCTNTGDVAQNPELTVTEEATDSDTTDDSDLDNDVTNSDDKSDKNDTSEDSSSIIEVDGYKQISQTVAKKMMEEESDYIILDVRTYEEYEKAHIPDAICIPNGDIGTGEIAELPDKDQLILVYCRSGRRSKEASKKLVDLGYTNVYEFGGIIDWAGATVSGSHRYPEYTGEAFVELNDNKPDFTDDEKKSTEPFEEYSELDDLGRCGVAFANVCPALMPTEERGKIGEIRPSGWQTAKYNDLIEDNFLYNRSHLIAFSLAGENANEKNLITGTRYMNQETMQIFELQVLDYVRETGNHVLYRVTPDFVGDNLVASGVQMEAWSVEDNGGGICFNVYCFNVQPHIQIDYATGDSWRGEFQKDSSANGSNNGNGNNGNANDNSATNDNNTNDNNTNSGSFTSESRDYVLNTNTMKVHLPACDSVKDMSDSNKKETTSSLDELRKQGYEPCGSCLGQYK